MARCPHPRGPVSNRNTTCSKLSSRYWVAPPTVRQVSPPNQAGKVRVPGDEGGRLPLIGVEALDPVQQTLCERLLQSRGGTEGAACFVVPAPQGA